MYVLFTNFNLRSPITFCVTLSTPLCTIVYVAHVDVDEIIIQFNSIQSHMDEGKWTSDKVMHLPMQDECSWFVIRLVICTILQQSGMCCIFTWFYIPYNRKFSWIIKNDLFACGSHWKKKEIITSRKRLFPSKSKPQAHRKLQKTKSIKSSEQ